MPQEHFALVMLCTVGVCLFVFQIAVGIATRRTARATEAIARMMHDFLRDTRRDRAR